MHTDAKAGGVHQCFFFLDQMKHFTSQKRFINVFMLSCDAYLQLLFLLARMECVIIKSCSIWKESGEESVKEVLLKYC